VVLHWGERDCQLVRSRAPKVLKAKVTVIDRYLLGRICHVTFRCLFDIADLVPSLRAAGLATTAVEVKSAGRGIPQTLDGDFEFPTSSVRHSSSGEPTPEATRTPCPAAASPISIRSCSPTGWRPCARATRAGSDGSATRLIEPDG
jgi:hypothetical protein